MSTAEETLRTEREAHRASSRHHAQGRYSTAIARYLAAYDYADRKLRDRRARESKEEPKDRPV
jgi:hypothetical protein